MSLTINNGITPTNNENHRQFLNDVLNKEVFKRLETPVTWNSVLPQRCYQYDFNWSADCVTVLGKDRVGTFADMGLKEAKDVPTVEFSLKRERIDVYGKEVDVEVTSDEMEHFRLWTSVAGLSENSFVNQLVESVVDEYNATHNRLFFFGDGQKTKGLFNNAAVHTLTSAEKDPVKFIARNIAAIRTATLGAVKAGTVLISPAVYGLLQNYVAGSDKSDLEKVADIIADATGGEPTRLKIKVLDTLSTSPTDVNVNDVFFLDSNPSRFVYYYKPLILYPFREWKARSYIAAAAFKYSDPYIYAPYALCKCRYTP
jgi:hypothetical protein